jgi:hypothetical protein
VTLVQSDLAQAEGGSHRLGRAVTATSGALDVAAVNAGIAVGGSYAKVPLENTSSKSRSTSSHRYA